MYTVSLRRCTDYEQSAVDSAVKALFDDLGGLDKFVKRGMKVVIKPNLLMAKAPERAATTHPSVVAAAARMCVELGAIVYIADSPGGPYSAINLKNVYSATGMAAAAKQTGALLHLKTEVHEIYNPDAVVLKKMTLCDFAADADCIINIAKLKTHGLAAYTGAVKNLFGCIPGMIKAEYHLRMNNALDFFNMIVDLADYVAPALNIIDGIVGMEGDGPSAGTPKKMGLLLASENAFAADMAAIKLINYEPTEIYTIARAVERGILTGDFDRDINMVGEPLKKNIVKGFNIASENFESNRLKGRVGNNKPSLFSRLMAPKPVIQKSKCVSCGVCGQNCPPKAIKFIDKTPVIDYKECIKCFCCQELCPEEAIKIRRATFFKWMR